MTSIPSAAQALLAKPFIPGWLYRAMGAYGWKQQAKPYGAEKVINDNLIKSSKWKVGERCLNFT